MKKNISLDKTCFAYDAKKDQCDALRDCTGCGKNCAFYKTRKQAAADNQHHDKRLRSLKGYEQAGIARTYYKGGMPWAKGAVQNG
jgi:hypothetical protein